ncbi:MAG: ribonuclease Y [Candidatus Bipolaricaulia bacterium]
MWWLIIGGILAVLLGYWLGRAHLTRQLAREERRATEIIAAAREEAEQLRQEALLAGQEELQRRREELERELKRRTEKLELLEGRLIKREERLEEKGEQLERLEGALKDEMRHVAELAERGEKLLAEEQESLERIAGLSREEAREELLHLMESESDRLFTKWLKRRREQLEAEAEREARRIIAAAIQRYAPEEVEETTVSSVPLPNDDYKGRIIGREGRNIRTFEALTGVEVLVDDTPDTVVLSSFNPIRRGIARTAMERLIEDGRIHPAHIKKQVEWAEQRMIEHVRELGQKAIFELGIDNIHPELVMLIGRLNYRTSYGQNQLQHSLEVAYIVGMLAAELGLEPKLAKRAGILHDIGKAVDHKVEGSHSLISADLARRYGESEAIIHAIAAHNGEVEPQTVLAILLQAADALSAARPGARQETFEAYIQRLQELEEICTSFPGVEEAYAIQAGREVRVIVKPEEVDDELAAKLSYDIARTIEEEMNYPGEIRVNVVRETQFVQLAK